MCQISSPSPSSPPTSMHLYMSLDANEQNDDRGSCININTTLGCVVLVEDSWWLTQLIFQEQRLCCISLTYKWNHHFWCIICYTVPGVGVVGVLQSLLLGERICDSLHTPSFTLKLTFNYSTSLTWKWFPIYVPLNEYIYSYVHFKVC